LCDINTELINAYEVVRDDTEKLIKQLKKYEYSKDFFLEIRARDQEENFQTKRSPVERASRFIYLNRTCFN
jgi:DNA adenine methylase